MAWQALCRHHLLRRCSRGKATEIPSPFLTLLWPGRHSLLATAASIATDFTAHAATDDATVDAAEDGAEDGTDDGSDDGAATAADNATLDSADDATDDDVDDANEVAAVAVAGRAVSYEQGVLFVPPLDLADALIDGGSRA